MTCKDRSLEFSSIVKSLQSHVPPNKPHTPSVRSSEFTIRARHIGYELNCTLAKLEKLTELARGRSLFGDPASEIQNLTQIIKEDIAKLNSDIAGLQQYTRAQATSRIGSKHLKSHSGAVVISLQTKLVDLSQGFKGVLELRTENLKVQQQRREQFSTAPLPSSFSTKQNGVVGHNESLLLGTGSSPDVSIDMDSVQRDQSQMLLLQEQDTYIQERADAMENIHSTIVELGQIFRQLATMVKEQEEQVIRIDTNVTETQINVEAGYGELLKYFKGVTSNRWLMVKIFAVVIIFFIIFIVFLA